MRVRLRDFEPNISILDAVHDDALFAEWFRDRKSWRAWIAFLCALFGLQMSDKLLAIYRECTGRTEPPDQVASEAWLVCGRRAGKSFILAIVAVFLAAFFDYRRYLQPGERGVIMVIAADRKQARVIFRYVRGLLTGVPMLRRLIEHETKESIHLNNSVSIEISTASFRSTRGFTLVAALLDEIAFWRSEDSANPDTEILNAIRPAMATIPTAMLLCASSPYARRGVLWNAHRKHYGKDHDPVLVWQAPTLTMNPSVPLRIIEEAYEADPASAAAEYGAQFRTDVEALLTREAIDAVVSPGVIERPYVAGTRYEAFVDPSGGSSDSMCLAIGHSDADGMILDVVRERKPPFSPESVVSDFAATLKAYNVRKVTGDRYGGEWPREVFRKHGIQYVPSVKTKSDIYRDVLPLINSKQADLLDNDRLVNQFVGLERRTARGGKDSIDHAPGAHDDLANVAAGVLVNLGSLYRGDYDIELRNVMRRDDEKQSSTVSAISSLSNMLGSRFW